jgi:hypothetical protein
MKETKLYKVFIIFGIISLVIGFSIIFSEFVLWGFDKYQDYKHPVKPGMIMFLGRAGEDPFAKKDTIWIRIIQIKDKYVQYEYLNRDHKDTTSSSINYIRYFTTVKK